MNERYSYLYRYAFIIYFCVAVLFLMRIIFPTGSIIKRSIFLTYYLLSLYYCCMCIKEYCKEDYLKGIMPLIAVLLIYSIIFIISGTDITWHRLASPLYYFSIHFESISPILVFYYFTISEAAPFFNRMFFPMSSIF